MAQDELLKQIPLVLSRYSGLKKKTETESHIILEGTIFVERFGCDFSIRKEYEIQLGIPKNSYELPFAKEIGGDVPDTYVHKYSDDTLCLETDAAIRLRFIDGIDLCAWIEEFVEPYFFSYEFYNLYGTFPYGERSHGTEGVLETYRDIFHAKDLSETFSAMRFVDHCVYRGHNACFCNSGKSLRACHGKWIISFFTDLRKKEVLKRDLRKIEAEIDEYRRNQEKTK